MQIKLSMLLMLITQSYAFAAQPHSISNNAGNTAQAAAQVAAAVASKTPAKEQAKNDQEQTTHSSSAAGLPAQAQPGVSNPAASIVGGSSKPWWMKIHKGHGCSKVQLFGKYDWTHNTKTSGVKGTEIYENDDE